MAADFLYTDPKNDGATAPDDNLRYDESKNAQTNVVAVADGGVSDVDAKDDYDPGANLANLNQSLFDALFTADGMTPALFDINLVNTSFAEDNGAVSETSSTATTGPTDYFFKVTAGSNETITNLRFSDSNNDPFFAEPAKYDSGATDFLTSNGSQVYLYSLKDGDLLIGSTEQLSVGDDPTTLDETKFVFAYYLDEAYSTDNKEAYANIHGVHFAKIDHPDNTDHDDAIDFGEFLHVTADTSLSFNFDTLESGKFLWVAVGDNQNGLVVTGSTLNYDATGNRISGGSDPSDAVNTSQGGQGATIGIDNQQFVPGETAVFSLTKGFGLLGAGPDATGDNINEIQYSDFKDVSGAALFISQKQGNPANPLDMTISVWSAGGAGTAPEIQEDYYDPDGDGPLVGGTAFDDDTPVQVASVTVTNTATGNSVTWNAADLANASTPTTKLLDGENVGIDLETTGTVGNIIKVTNADALYTISWEVADGSTFNRFQLTADAGKFDVGRVDITEGGSAETNVGQYMYVHDDGPSVTANQDAPTLTVDDDDFSTNASADFKDIFTFGFGTDGPAGDAEASGLSYALVLDTTAGNTTGLKESLTGNDVLLKTSGNDIVGYYDNSGSHVEVFRISLSGTTVTFDQSLAVKHDTSGGPAPSATHDDSTDLTSGLAKVKLQLTATDDDGDTDSLARDITASFKIKDDGPVIELKLSGSDISIDMDESVGDPGAPERSPNGIPPKSDDIGGVDGPDGTNPFGSVATTSGQITGLFADLTKDAGNDGEKSREDDYALTLNDKDGNPQSVATAFKATDGVASTLDVSAAVASGGDATIHLYLISDTVIEGRVDLDGDGNFTDVAIRFTLSGDLDDADADPILTTDQILAIKHATGGNDPDSPPSDVGSVHDEKASFGIAGADPTKVTGPGITKTTKLTDNDNDYDQDSITYPFADKIDFDDDGPLIDRSEAAIPSLTTDDTNIDDADNKDTDSKDFSVLYDAPDYGSDGAAATNPLTYALSVETEDGATTMKDVLTGETIYLRTVSGVVEGYYDDGATSDEIVFTISVDGSGNVTQTQFRAIAHLPNSDDTSYDESIGITGLNKVYLTAKVTDADGDTEDEKVDITSAFNFKDDGPDIELGVSGNSLTIELDESIGPDPSADESTGTIDPYPDDFSGQIGRTTTPTDTAISDVADLFTTTKNDPGNDGEKSLTSSYKLELRKADGTLATISATIIAANGVATTMKVSEDPATSGGDTIVLFQTSATVIEGWVDLDLDGTFDKKAISFTLLDANTADPKIQTDQFEAILHGDNTDHDDAETLGILDAQDDAVAGLNVVKTSVLTDGDDDVDTSSASKNFTKSVLVEDDGPLIKLANATTPTLTTDDTDLTPDQTNFVDFEFLFEKDFGTDGPKAGDSDTAVTYHLEIEISDTNSGLKDSITNYDILLRVNASGDVEGYFVDVDELLGNDDAAEFVAFTIELKSSTEGELRLVQQRALKHPDTDDPDEADDPLTIDNVIKVKLVATATDDDGDQASVTKNIATAFQFKDDGPSIGGDDNAIPDGSVDFTDGDSDSQPLEDGGGQDTWKNYTITEFEGQSAEGSSTGTYPINGVNLKVLRSADGDTVSYFDDANGDGVPQESELYYTLELFRDDADTYPDSEGYYTFTVWADAPAVFTPFNFDDLPAGQNLFGIIGDAKDETVEGDEQSIILLGRDPDTDEDGKLTNQSQTINSSKGSEWSESVVANTNNSINTTEEGIWITYAFNSDPEFTATGEANGLSQTEADFEQNILVEDFNEVGGAFFQIAQVVGNADADVRIKAYDLDDSKFDADGEGMGTALGGKTYVDNLDTFNTSDPNGGDLASTIATAVPFTTVIVYEPGLITGATDFDGFDVAEKWIAPDPADPSAPSGDQGIRDDITITLGSDGFIYIEGLESGMVVQWFTDGEHDTTLIDHEGGKFDIGFVGISEINETPEQELDFTVEIEDFDGDTEEASFTVTIEGTDAGV